MKPAKTLGIMIAAVLLLAVAVFLFAGRKAHSAACDTREAILEAASTSYGEVPNAGGSNRLGTLFTELLLAPDGSFTIIMSRPDGWACVISSGIGWSELGGIPGKSG